MTTALVTHADCLGHETPPGHPERVARLEHVLHALAGLDLKRITAPLAAEDDILRIHPAGYIADLRNNLPAQGFFGRAHLAGERQKHQHHDEDQHLQAPNVPRHSHGDQGLNKVPPEAEAEN